MLSCRARAATRLDLDTLGRSIRVSFDERLFCCVSGFSLAYLAPFAGIVPTVRSPLQVVALFIPFTGRNSLPAIVSGNSMAVCRDPSTFCTIFAFRVLDPTFGSHPDIHWTSLRNPV